LILLAIDPGNGGALAWIGPTGELIDVADMPVNEVRGKRRISAALLASFMKSTPITGVLIEGVGAMPRDGTSGAFTFGYGAGLLEGVAAGLGLPVEIIPASVWKQRAGVPKDKGAARQMAQRTWPLSADKFKRVRDDGRAEAALLGRWAILR
jgi:crossover junction endodeoxyribonuclease RuvC